jgi:hypothetical protein
MKALAARVALAALAFVASGAAAQTVYRCGNEYRADPCPGGKAVRSDDLAASPDRLAEGRAVAAREKRLADDMARDRRAREAVPPPKAGSLGPSGPARDQGPAASAKPQPKKKANAKIRVLDGKAKGDGKIRVLDEKDFVAEVPAKATPR